MKFAKLSFPAILCIVLVAACSGSGGSDAPTPTPSSMANIDASNAETIAGGVVDAVFASGSFGDVVGGGGSGSLVGRTDNGFSKAGGLFGYFANVPIPETNSPCAVDGSVIVSGEVLDPNTLSGGDRVRLEFFDCNDGAGQVLNGNYEIAVNTFSGDLFQGLIDLNATTTFDRFEVVEGSEMTSLNGTVTLHLDTSTPPVTCISVSGASMSVNDSTDALKLSDFRTDITHDAGVAPQAYTSTASGTLTSILFEGEVNYSTPVPIQGFEGEYPYPGELLVTGADDASVGLMALDNVNVRLEIDPADGSSTVTQETTWTNVANPPISDKETGITGIVLRGPINPGPAIQGEINEAPFRGLFSVRDSKQIVARFQSDDNGNFSVGLLPGDYTIVADASVILHAEQQPSPVTVPDSGFADVTLTFDTGIR